MTSSVVSFNPFQRLFASQNVHKKVSSASFINHECQCQGLKEKKHCLFIHGAGGIKSLDTPQVSSEYWKIDKSHAPCCKTIHYAELNTRDQAWYDPSLISEFCTIARALSSAPAQSNELRNVMLITHSMGNLFVAEALRTRNCTLDRASSKWVSIQAPWIGCRSADKLSNDCLKGKEKESLKSSSWANDARKVPEEEEPRVSHTNDFFDSKLANAVIYPWLKTKGYCPIPRAHENLVHRNGYFASQELKRRYDAVQPIQHAHVDARLCGTHAGGLKSVFSAMTFMLGTRTDTSAAGDGVIGFDSCAHGVTGFTTSPWNRNYKARINHVDGTMRFNDGKKQDQRPNQWFKCLWSKEH